MKCEKFNLSLLGIIASVVCLALLIYAAIAIWKAGLIAVTITYIILGLLALWVLCNIPRYLIVDSKSIIIIHPIGQTTIRKADITEITPLAPQDIKGSLRIFGSGGFFGWYGIFSNTKIGRYRLYSGDCKNLYLIRTIKSAYVISCKNTLEL